ncbi:MAG: glucosyltransferase [Phycisphaerales bacterium]|nr:glucosyltransferase [Phycisphaerales bacterium]
MSKRLILAILCCGALYLVGNGRVSLWDRDEPRYAQASRQMLASGDWVVPKLLDEPRIKKPPLIYWCQAASMAAFNRIAPDDSLTIEQRMQRDAAAARLPSSIAIVLTLILIAVVLVRIAGKEQAFWTVLIFGTSGLVVMSAKMCLTDAVLLLFVTASQFCLYAMYRRRATWPVVVAFAISTGLGLLTKGPVVLGVNAMTLIVLGLLALVDRRAARSTTTPRVAWANLFARGLSHLPKILIAIAIIAAICAPWIVFMQHRIPGGLGKVFDREILDRMTQPLEQHKGPPGYYLLFFLISFFPWCLFLPTAIKIAWQNRRDPLLRFSFAAVVGPWLMFECIQTKLPHYVLPCFPFLAIMTAHALVLAARGEQRDWQTRRWLIAVGAFSLILIALGLGPWAALPEFGFENLPFRSMTVVSIVAAFFAIMIFTLFARSRIFAAAYTMAAAMFVLLTLLFTLYLPNAQFLHLSERLGAYLQSAGATTKGDVYMIDYKEDSLPFYQGGTIRPQPKNTFLAVEPPEKWPTFLVITREIWNNTPETAKARLQVLQTFRGWAYAAKGRVAEVMVVKKKAMATSQPRSGEKK